MALLNKVFAFLTQSKHLFKLSCQERSAERGEVGVEGREDRTLTQHKTTKRNESKARMPITINSQTAPAYVTVRLCLVFKSSSSISYLKVEFLPSAAVDQS